jgi:hypothetical protein
MIGFHISVWNWLPSHLDEWSVFMEKLAECLAIAPCRDLVFTPNVRVPCNVSHLILVIHDHSIGVQFQCNPWQHSCLRLHRVHFKWTSWDTCFGKTIGRVHGKCVVFDQVYKSIRTFIIVSLWRKGFVIVLWEFVWPPSLKKHFCKATIN